VRALIAALCCGALFGAGMVVSDMINPARVLAFLDVAGDWDYSLALVMGGALLPAGIAFALRRRLDAPVFEDRFHVPTGSAIDLPLIGGAVLFGIGWGLAGFCPGPALAALVTGAPKVLIFVASMLAGVVLHRFTLGPRRA
jgi:uncharacterized membrane protein YedE/YeeE